MEAERKKRMLLKKGLQNNLLKIMWLLVGAMVMGGIYCLSHHNVDEAVVSESKNFFEFVRAVLR